ncbi:MAG: anhydro-N-acetylmuramic acid kinase, partial [Bacteroidetes bacterium]
MSSFRIIGLMSGTSLDGLDITFCTFSKKSEQNWDFDLHSATTIPYPDHLISQLKEIMHASAWELIKMDHDLAILWAEMVSQFIKKNDIDLSKIDAVASHGQTIFHRPDLGITTQIGNGQALA